MKFSSIALIAAIAGVTDAFAPISQGSPSATALSMSLEKYSDELKATAAAMVVEGKGLLACDESTGTVGARLESIGLENNEDNRREWRQLLFTTPNIGDCISGAILFEETLYQDSTEGEPFVDVLKKAGIIPGIKVDSGLKPLCGGGSEETWCSGLDGLYEKCCLHYAQGARFAKWRTAVRIDTDKGFPTDYAIDEAAHGLSRYARICQEAGLVPIVEPEILIDGDHDIHTTAKVQERLVTTVYKKLRECGVMLEGTLLKPSMTVCGVDCKDKPSVEEIGALTVQTLSRSIPSAMPGVTFLSGGISEEDSSIYLNEINKIDRVAPFRLTFSFSRALQSSCLKTWDGKKENVKAAQDQLFARAKANSEASKGEYTPGSQPSMQESLYVKNYVY